MKIRIMNLENECDKNLQGMMQQLNYQHFSCALIQFHTSAYNITERYIYAEKEKDEK